MIYKVGSLVRVSVIFIDNVMNDFIDPSEVYFRCQSPGGSSVYYQYGNGAEILKDSEGHYHVDISLDYGGEYSYGWYGKGTGQAAVEGSMSVEASRF